MTRKQGSIAVRSGFAAVAFVLLVGCVPPRSARFEVVYVDREPPPTRVEVITTRPGAEFAWVQGYWRWERSDYAWAPGHWERAPHPRAVWVTGRWRRDRHGWYFAPGHWR